MATFRRMEFDLPDPYRLRPYRGGVDHPAMLDILHEHRRHMGDLEMPTSAQFDLTYANLENCDPAVDIAIVEREGPSGDGAPIGYVRSSWEDLDQGGRDAVVFAPLLPDHANRPLFEAVVTGQEAHMRPWTHGIENARFRAYATHPGPDLPATDEAAWLEGLGYTATSFGAALVRPHLDDIPDRQLPDGVELRPVTDDVLRTIFDAHWAAFVDDWDYRDATESDFRMFVDDPNRDVTLWKIAWAGDTVVGQVKSFINHEENAEMGYLRGYTEQISTAAGWRNRGIAGTLLAMSLRELRDRGMTEAALGVDTDNPGGAFQLYTGLGFELRSYEAIYHKPAN